MPRVIPRTVRYGVDSGADRCRPVRAGRACALALCVLATGLAGSGCGTVPAPLASRPAGEPATGLTVVAGWEREFALIRRLGVRRYSVEPLEGCEVFEYGRGLFVSAPEDEFCGWRQGGEPSRARLPFDGQAQQDLRSFLSDAAAVGPTPRYLKVVGDAEGHVVGGAFSSDLCRDYLYRPGWTEMPQANPGEVIVPVDSDWLEVSYCGPPGDP